MAYYWAVLVWILFLGPELFATWWTARGTLSRTVWTVYSSKLEKLCLAVFLQVLFVHLLIEGSTVVGVIVSGIHATAIPAGRFLGRWFEWSGTWPTRRRG